MFQDDFDANALAVQMSTAAVMGVADYNNIIIMFPKKPVRELSGAKQVLKEQEQGPETAAWTVIYSRTEPLSSPALSSVSSSALSSASDSTLYDAKLSNGRHKGIPQLQEVQCSVKYTVSIILGEGNAYPDAASAYSLSTASLASAVSSGGFTQSLQTVAAAAGSQSMLTAAAMKVCASFNENFPRSLFDISITEPVSLLCLQPKKV